MDSDEDQRRPDRRSRQLVTTDGLSLGADNGESERMGPIGDASEQRAEAMRRTWEEYQVAKEDSEVLIASRPRTRSMTAEQTPPPRVEASPTRVGVAAPRVRTATTTVAQNATPTIIQHAKQRKKRRAAVKLAASSDAPAQNTRAQTKAAADITKPTAARTRALTKAKTAVARLMRPMVSSRSKTRTDHALFVE